MMFIELTQSNSLEKVFINMNLVECFKCDSGGRTCLYGQPVAEGPSYFRVIETPEEIIKKMHPAITFNTETAFGRKPEKENRVDIDCSNLKQALKEALAIIDREVDLRVDHVCGVNSPCELHCINKANIGKFIYEAEMLLEEMQ